MSIVSQNSGRLARHQRKKEKEWQKKRRPIGLGRNNQPGRIRSIVAAIEKKYFDYLSLANSIGAGSTIFPIQQIPQGNGQSQRVGDFVSICKMIFNFTFYCVNSDIVTTTRLILFRWIPNTGSVTPTVALILEAPSSSNVLSHFNFENQMSYEILWDRTIRSAGIPASPTSTSNVGGTNIILPLGKNRDQQFDLGSTTGASGQMYLMAISDSSLTPFGLLNFSMRTYFEDTVRQVNRKMVK